MILVCSLCWAISKQRTEQRTGWLLAPSQRRKTKLVARILQGSVCLFCTQRAFLGRFAPTSGFTLTFLPCIVFPTAAEKCDDSLAEHSGDNKENKAVVSRASDLSSLTKQRPPKIKVAAASSSDALLTPRPQAGTTEATSSSKKKARESRLALACLCSFILSNQIAFTRARKILTLSAHCFRINQHRV